MVTESVSETTCDKDLCVTREMAKLMDREDTRVAEAVRAERDHIAREVDRIGAFKRLNKEKQGITRYAGHNSEPPPFGGGSEPDH